MAQYRYRIAYKHFDGDVMVLQDDVSLEFGTRTVEHYNNKVVTADDGREWWLERQPLGEWEKV